jgi:predicted TPR repeat methyltransferase
MRRWILLLAFVLSLLLPLPGQTSAEDWRQRGNTLYRAGKFAEALDAYNRSIQLDPGNPKAYVGRGSSHKNLGHKREALADYSRAIELDPAYSNAWMNRGSFYYENGDFRAALSDYDKAIEANPNNAPALYSRGMTQIKLKNVSAARADLERSLEADPNNAFASQAKAALAGLPAPGPERKPQAPPAPPPLTQPPPGPPAYLPVGLDINHLTPASYDAALRASREAVRILLGPMSAEDEKRFEKKWDPLFEYPCQPVIEYFNKLAPLLNQFLDTRAALQHALIAFNDAYEEAITAAGLDDNAGVREAMDVAGIHRNSVAALDIRLHEIAKDIEALGDPPDPTPYRRRARELQEETARFLKKGAPTGTTFWVLTNATVDSNPKESSDQIKYTHVVSEGYAKGSRHESYIPYGERSARRRSAVGEIRWTPPPPVMPAPKFLDFAYAMNVSLTCSDVQNYGANEDKDTCARIFIDPSANGTDNYAQLTPKQPSFAGVIRIDAPRVGQFKQLLPLKVKVEVATPGGYTHFWYHYELRELTPAQVAEIQARAEQSAQGRAQAQAEAGASSAELLSAIYDAQTQQEAKLEAIAFAKENQKYFQARAEEYRRSAAGASTAAERDRFQYLAMVMDANLQAEKDNQSTMETGQWTRTRTEYDDWNFHLMAAQSQAAAREYSQRSAAMAAVPRLAAQLPPELRDVARSETNKAIGEAIARGDTAGVQRAVNALAEQTKDYWTKRAAAQQNMAEFADKALSTASAIKTGADTALFALSFLGGSAIYSGYMGITGGIEGAYQGGAWNGVTAATRSVVGSVHPYAMVALSAYDGYAQAEGRGAAENAARSAIYALAMQRVVAPAIGRVIRTVKGPVPEKWPTVEQQLGEARFQSRMANGRAKVKLFQERAQLAALARGADPQKAAQLEAQVAEAARVIKCDYTAKMVLNQAGRTNPGLVKAYLRQDEQWMAAVEKEFQRGMAAQGYRPVEVRRFSNSASAGKAGMDVDIGIVEPRRFLRAADGSTVKNPEWERWRVSSLARTGPDGKPQLVSLNEYQQAGQRQLQEAFDKVYGAPGRPTKEAFVNFTTSQHAEAYSDPAWIGRRGLPHADFDNIQPGSAKQAGEVTAYKVSHLVQQGAKVPEYLKLQEGCRTLVKDFNTKLIGSTTNAVNPQAPLAKASAPVQQQVLKLRAVMDSFAKNEIGPIEADRRIKELTGGEGLPAVVRQFQSLLVAGSK